MKAKEEIYNERFTEEDTPDGFLIKPNFETSIKDEIEAAMQEYADSKEQTGMPSEELVNALTELVRLKQYKLDHGKSPYYLKHQPKAWEKARIVLDNLKSLQPKEGIESRGKQSISKESKQKKCISCNGTDLMKSEIDNYDYYCRDCATHF